MAAISSRYHRPQIPTSLAGLVSRHHKFACSIGTVAAIGRGAIVSLSANHGSWAAEIAER